MSGLTPLDSCLANALDGLGPAAPRMVPLAEAVGRVLALDLRLTADWPPSAVALRPGLAVAALDLVGATSHNPVPLGDPVRVTPGMAMPPGTDAVLPEEGVERSGPFVEAIRTVAPGEGVRHAGDDGRAGHVLLEAGRILRPQHRLAAGVAEVEHVAVREVRVHCELPPSAAADFVVGWLAACGAALTPTTPHLVIRQASEHRPRLALAPGEGAWLGREAGGLELHLPGRFDGIVAALLALVLPALEALTGARVNAVSRPVRSRITSAVGLAEIALLRPVGESWQPSPAGLITLEGLASAEAFAIIPPASEGLPAGALLAGTTIHAPFD